MKNLITKYNADKIMNEVGSIEGKNIMVNDTWLTKVKDIVIEYIPIDEDIPDEIRDGSEENTINIIFNFIDGIVSVSFCPERQVCEVWHETDELLIFHIVDTEKYIQQEKDRLEFMQKEYNEYMNK